MRLSHALRTDGTHALVRLLVVIFASLIPRNSQLILQTINTVSCRFVYKESESGTSSGGILSFGLYSVGYNGVCVEQTHGYDAIDADGDRLLTSARVCNIVSMTSGVIAMVLVATECIRCKIGCGNLLESLAFLVAWTTGL
mmetsp:Transcript_5868/g.16715  ORF Transcript_5868/g.16715 Transcript_5868/m.16715 type:complete len:141 (-) Transcript_5868:54-476(-)